MLVGDILAEELLYEILNKEIWKKIITNKYYL
jgi:hypothetical protein